MCHRNFPEFQNPTLDDILTAHVDIINVFNMNRLVDEGTLSERDEQDEVCRVLQSGLTTTSIHPYFL